MDKIKNKINNLPNIHTIQPILFFSYGKDSVTILSILMDMNIKPLVFTSELLGCTEFDEKYHNYIENLFDINVIRIYSSDNNMKKYIKARELLFNRKHNPLKGIHRYLKLTNSIQYNTTFKNATKNGAYIFQGNTKGNSVILKDKEFEFQNGNIINPLYDFDDIDSTNYLKEKGIKLHPVYKMGFSKNTCFPCFCWTNGEHFEFLDNNINLLKTHFQSQFEKWVEFEEQSGYPFFRTDKWEPIYLKDYK